MEILVSEIFPRTAVFACAIIMAAKIYKGHHIGSKEHQAWQAKFTLDSRAIDQLKVLIMVISFIFVFLTLPKSGYLIFRYLEENGVIDIVNDMGFEDPSAIIDALVNAIFSNVDYMFFSLKFFVYIAVSRRFRYEFVCLFKCIACCRNISFRYQKQRGSFSQPLVRDSTYNSLLATTFDHLPQTVLGNDNGVQTSLITTVWHPQYILYFQESYMLQINKSPYGRKYISVYFISPRDKVMFSVVCVCQSVCPRVRGPMWLLPVMHWTSLYRDPLALTSASPGHGTSLYRDPWPLPAPFPGHGTSLYKDPRLQAHPSPPPDMCQLVQLGPHCTGTPTSDLWWLGQETYSNLITWGPLLVPTCGGCWSTYCWHKWVERILLECFLLLYFTIKTTVPY